MGKLSVKPMKGLKTFFPANVFLLKALSLISLSFFACHASVHAAVRNPAGFEIQRGINLSHWLSQDFGWFDRDRFITENDLRYIASLGYDHVRLPIDEKEIWHEDGSFNESAIAHLHNGIQWALKYDLGVIVDMHVIRSHHFNAANEGGTNTLWDDPAEQEKFFDLWRQLSGEIAQYPVNKVAYEIMNEPVAEDPEDWNKLVENALAAIRELEPNRVIVIGSNRWQIPQTVPLLKIPEGDKNIILSTHTYVPFLLTHYTAGWTPMKFYKGEVNYPGPTISEEEYLKMKGMKDGDLGFVIDSVLDDWGPERLYQELKPAIDRAEELGLQLYCGEFGCMPTVKEEDRLAYYRDIVSTFEAHGMAWANWEYKGDFGIFEWFYDPLSYGAPNEPMIEALLGQKASTLEFPDTP